MIEIHDKEDQEQEAADGKFLLVFYFGEEGAEPGIWSRIWHASFLNTKSALYCLTSTSS
jgi:hypothetical protein